MAIKTMHTVHYCQATPAMSSGRPERNAPKHTVQASLLDGRSLPLTTSVTWTSSNPDVASIDDNGLALGKATGQTTITASVGDISDKAVLTVTDATLMGIEISPPSPSIAPGESQEFTISGNYTDGSSQALTEGVSLSSSKPGEASVTPGTRNVVGQAFGTTTVTAAVGSKTAGTTLGVVPPTWVQRTSTTTAQLNATGFFNNLFLAGGANGTIVTSSDGLTWTVSDTPDTFTISSFSFSNGSFIAGRNDDGTVLTSSSAADGTWTPQSITAGVITRPQNALASFEEFSVAVSSETNSLRVSNNATPPFSAIDDESQFYPDLGFGAAFGLASRLVVVGTGGLISYFDVTSNSPTHSSSVSPTTDRLLGVAFSGERFVAVGESGAIALSTDATGTAFTSVGAGATTNTLRAVPFARDRFIAVGDSGTSSNLTGWNELDARDLGNHRQSARCRRQR